MIRLSSQNELTRNEEVPMKLAKVKRPNGEVLVVSVNEDHLLPLNLNEVDNVSCLADILNSPDPNGLASYLIDSSAEPIPFDNVTFEAPIDEQEVWAAGVTYKRSQVARMEESADGADHYDKVYSADRPEIFYKSNARRVSGPGEPVRVRFDSNWSVPEPEFTLVVAPSGKIVGYTIGNDMSARDIEGENPLYLPQAKLYNQCCGLGPAVLLADQPLDRAATKIVLTIERAGETVFSGETDLDQMARTFEDLVEWLGKENDLPSGAFLLTGTGVVPPDNFTLEDGDNVSIEITGIGTLTNPVVKSSPA
jgi:2-dehydro-3-deoxy-D-arabinonate dehydratase